MPIVSEQQALDQRGRVHDIHPEIKDKSILVSSQWSCTDLRQSQPCAQLLDFNRLAEHPDSGVLPVGAAP